MNTKLIIGVVAVVVGTTLLGVIWYVARMPGTVQQGGQGTAPVTTFPTSNPTSVVTPVSTTSPVEQQKKILIPLRDGTSAEANDFLHNGVTIPAGTRGDTYLLAGNLGYCYVDPQKCQAATTTDFTVYYDSGRHSFVIDLTKEPIGQSRLDMEQFMSTTLGVSQQQMCNLNYLVSVTRYVNEHFAGANLGFSFCPGATKLPK
jgi:hypothetical protein